MILLGIAVAHAGELATFQPEDPGAEDPEYFPVPAVGAVSVFSVNLTSEDGKVSKGKLKQTFEKQEELQGHRYLKEVVDPEGLEDWEREVTYYRYAADGIHTIEGRAKTTPESLYIPFPLAVGKTWSYSDPNSGEITHCKAEAVEDLKIGEQIYKTCLKISESQDQGDGQKIVTETWYAPHLGQVKISYKSGSMFRVDMLLLKPASAAK
jgi:hypothetical protein